MFIKIKLEPQSIKALSPLKAISYFSIEDDATITNLKNKIEKFVDVPTERQEIRTLSKVFENNLLVKEVCDVRGSSIMLYSYNDEYENPQFVCFLQVYTDELAVQQQEFEQLSKQTAKNKSTTLTSSSTTSVILIADSDIEDSAASDAEIASNNSYSSESESDSSTDNSSSTCRNRKRFKSHNQIVQNKKIKIKASSQDKQYPETLCQYLDEFPKSSNPSDSIKNQFENKSLQTTANIYQISKSTPNESNKNDNKGSSIEDKIESYNSLKTSSTRNSLGAVTNIQSDLVTSTNINSQNRDPIKHPCYSINPEIRDYLAIISPAKDKTDISDIECKEILNWFFDRFRSCETSNQLQFDSKFAITLYEGKIWIACMDVNTFEWISENVSKYTLKSYRISPLNEKKYMCEVVVPIASSRENILEIFDLFEKQNKGVVTVKWSLQKRCVLLTKDTQFDKRAISLFCTNELFHLTVDKDSKENLERRDFKLKYCFWNINFKFT